LTGQDSVESQTDVLRRLWQAGEISTTDYLVQVRQTLDVRARALGLREALWRAWFEWLRASGKIDEWLALPKAPSVGTGEWISGENENE
jgi:cobalt-zinc-cadmium efflux system outer membrane protein